MSGDAARMAELSAVGLQVRRDRATLRSRLDAGTADWDAVLAHPSVRRMPVETVLLMDPRLRSLGHGRRNGGAAGVAASVCQLAGCSVWHECGRLTDRQRRALATEMREL